jgi:CheY-like chemotaxis protein
MEPLKRILIADDDPVTRRLLVSAVRSSGFTPIEATDGRETYKILERDSEFRAAVLDLTMPFLNGLELIQYMGTEKRLRRIPVMLLTADDELHWMSECFSAGAVMFLAKPFSVEQLQSAIRMLQ